MPWGDDFRDRPVWDYEDAEPPGWMTIVLSLTLGVIIGLVVLGVLSAGVARP